MREDLRQRLFAVFQAEHAEHQVILRQFLNQTEGAPLSEEALNEAFRSAHSLKGAARAVELEVVVAFAHQIESFFSLIKREQIGLSEPLKSLCLQALDLCEDWVRARTQQQTGPDPEACLSAITRALETANQGPGPAQAESGRVSSEAIVPPRLPGSGLSEPLRQHVQHEQIRISAQRLDHLRDLSNRLLIKSQQSQVLESHLTRLSQAIKEPQIQTSAYASLRLQREQAWRLQQDLQQLQIEINQLQRIPARSVFESFPSMLRQLAAQTGKEIRCQFTGLELELDRQILQALKDPVMHILRNALAHGIELPAERIKKGKSRQGLISCQLEIVNQRLIMRLADDGQGLDISEIQATRSGEQAAGDVIFEAGFTTTKHINALSGRGMGLSVVAETLARIQGSYRVVSRPEPGLCIELNLPLQVVNTRLLLIRLETHKFAIPTAGIELILPFAQTDLISDQGKPAIYYHQEVIRLVSLSEVLNLSAANLAYILVLKVGNQKLALQVEALEAECEAVVLPLSGPARHLNHLIGAILSPHGEPIPVLEPQYCFKLATARLEHQRFVAPLSVAAPKILVVDDSITTRTLEQSILESQGFEVVLAVDGVEGLQKLKQAEFDLLITDVQMPRMDGLELLRLVRMDPDLASLPVIIVTSLNHAEEQEQGLALGADAYIVKQKFTQQELLEVIAQLL